MNRIVRMSAVLILGLAYVVTFPIATGGILEGSKAFADPRDPGHASGDKGKQDTGKG